MKNESDKPHTSSVSPKGGRSSKPAAIARIQRQNLEREAMVRDLERHIIQVQQKLQISDFGPASVEEILRLRGERDDFLKSLLAEKTALLPTLRGSLTGVPSQPLAPSPDLADSPEPAINVRGTMVGRNEKVLIQEGVRYWPLPIAAEMSHAPRQTVLDWIKNDTKFRGRPLTSLYLPSVDRYFVAEESIERIATRFIRWPSAEPAGRVTIGTTAAQTGYLSTSVAAEIVGASPRTLWMWARNGKPIGGKTLDVVKCSTSDRFYIRESDVHELKKLVPSSGLNRGRRPHGQPPRAAEKPRP